MWIAARKLTPYLLILLLLAAIAFLTDHYWPSKKVPVSDIEEADTLPEPEAEDKLHADGIDTSGAEVVDTGSIFESEPKFEKQQEPQREKKEWTVVLGSFPTRQKAQKWMELHPEAENLTYVKEVDAYRVTGGFFSDLGQAQQYQEKVATRHPEAWITRM